MATTPAVILETLYDLVDEEFKKFKWHLLNGGLTHSTIPRGMLDKADRSDVVDLMVQQYKESDVGEIAVNALISIKQNELANQLKRKLQKGPEGVPAGGGSSSGGKTGTAQTAGVTMNINAARGGHVKAPVLHGGVFNGPVNFS